LFNLGRTAESTYWYEQAAKLKPNYADTYYNWGVAEYQMGNFQKAGELFDKVLKLNPDKKEASDAIQYMTYNGMYRRPAGY
jgi:tetratricopeptide (TPR) repeat protein